MVAKGIWDRSLSDDQARNNMLGYPSGLALPNAILRSGTLAANLTPGARFFKSAKWSSKVISQVNNPADIFHNFPKAIDKLAAES